MDVLQKARSLYAAGRMHDALEAAQSACDHHPKDAEAWWLLGCVSRYTDMPAASDDAFRRAAQLSRRRPAPHRLAPSAFQAIVDQLLGEQSPDSRRRLAPAGVSIEILPSIEEVQGGASPDALSLRRRRDKDELVLFQVNFENRAGSEADLRKLVARTVSRI